MVATIGRALPRGRDGGHARECGGGGGGGCCRLHELWADPWAKAPPVQQGRKVLFVLAYASVVVVVDGRGSSATVFSGVVAVMMMIIRHLQHQRSPHEAIMVSLSHLFTVSSGLAGRRRAPHGQRGSSGPVDGGRKGGKQK